METHLKQIYEQVKLDYPEKSDADAWDCANAAISEMTFGVDECDNED